MTYDDSIGFWLRRSPTQRRDDGCQTGVKTGEKRPSQISGMLQREEDLIEVRGRRSEARANS